MTTELVLEDFGGKGKRGYERYREYVERKDSQVLESPLEKVVASTFLGSKDFVSSIRAKYLDEKAIDERNVPAIKSFLRRPSVEDISKGAARLLAKDPSLNKKVCIYLSHRYSGMSLKEIGAHFGMKGSAVSQSSRRFEEMLKDHEELSKLVERIKRECLLNVET